MCLTLSHSLHRTTTLQSLATCSLEEQHLKHIPDSLRNALRSSMVLALKPLQCLRGCGFLCIGHCLPTSSRALEVPVESE